MVGVSAMRAPPARQAATWARSWATVRTTESGGWGMGDLGAKVSVLDLDLRQQSMAHFFTSRRAWLDANSLHAPMPTEHLASLELANLDDAGAMARFEAAMEAAKASDFVLIDTPGGDTP